MPRFPPVFGEWFVEKFPEPSAWYASRLAYARTTAVMSMVGYTVGLGDRHGENILFDSSTGEAVHVDLNCLFNRGELFETPERVPFRLTHNMVDAFGVTGYEGVFRRTCEVTMTILRRERDSLVTVLRTFMYDPLVEFLPRGPRMTEPKNELAASDFSKLHDIENRLKGIVRKAELPLSIEGQVHHLIMEATSIDNLSVMYIGWAPYL